MSAETETVVKIEPTIHVEKEELPKNTKKKKKHQQSLDGSTKKRKIESEGPSKKKKPTPIVETSTPDAVPLPPESTTVPPASIPTKPEPPKNFNKKCSVEKYRGKPMRLQRSNLKRFNVAYGLKLFLDIFDE